jgi:hypothetical protein
MNIRIPSIGNSYERLAINLAELIYELDGEQEDPLRNLLIKAYQEAYRKAAVEETAQDLEFAAAG